MFILIFIVAYLCMYVLNVHDVGIVLHYLLLTGDIGVAGEGQEVQHEVRGAAQGLVYHIIL